MTSKEGILGKRIFLSSPTMNGTEMHYINEAFETNWIAPLGKNVDEFEREIGEYLGEGYGCAISTGTAALHLVLKLCGIEEGDIVLCQTLTFAGSVNPIMYEKATPVFIDSEEDTWNMDPNALKKALIKYPNAKAVILVHLYGTPAKLDEITQICKEHKIILIEDAAESLGTRYKEKQTGTFGKYSILSFNGNKIITTSGGGMLLSKEKEDIEKAKYLATQAREPVRHYEHKAVGFNYRMSNVLAGIGRGQLSTIDKYITRKKKIYETYKKCFSDIKEISMNPYEVDKSAPNHWLSCLRIDKELEVKPLDLMMELEKEKIECRPLWKPMHMQPIFRRYDIITFNEGKVISENLFHESVCLPSDIKNTSEDMLLIVNIIRKLFHVDPLTMNEIKEFYEA
jgi:dTDP-4-amino-4,6-dideoxygalactose transaminase